MKKSSVTLLFLTFVFSSFLNILYSQSTSNVKTFAGSTIEGFQDGLAHEAKFWNPKSLVEDSEGNIYVADQLNHRIRKIDPTGYVTTVAGTGVAGFKDSDNPLDAQFNQPFGITLDTEGNLFVADLLNYRIRKITLGGGVTTFAGTGEQGGIDGSLDSAQFYAPSDLDFTSNGDLIVADLRFIRKICGGMIETIAGANERGFQDGVGEEAKFRQITGLDVGPNDLIYVNDIWNNAIRTITLEGEVNTIAGIGSTQTGYLNGRFSYPDDVVVDAQGNVYVADGTNFRVRRIDHQTGEVTRIAGPDSLSTKDTAITYQGEEFKFADGPADVAKFSRLRAITLRSNGKLLVVGRGNDAIREIDLNAESVPPFIVEEFSSGDNYCITTPNQSVPYHFSSKLVCINPESMEDVQVKVEVYKEGLMEYQQDLMVASFTDTIDINIGSCELEKTGKYEVWFRYFLGEELVYINRDEFYIEEELIGRDDGHFIFQMPLEWVFNTFFPEENIKTGLIGETYDISNPDTIKGISFLGSTYGVSVNVKFGVFKVEDGIIMSPAIIMDSMTINKPGLDWIKLLFSHDLSLLEGKYLFVVGENEMDKQLIYSRDTDAFTDGVWVWSAEEPMNNQWHLFHNLADPFYNESIVGTANFMIRPVFGPLVSTSTNEPKNTFDIKLYPNPTDSQLTISIGTDNVSDFQVQLFDVTGRKWLDLPMVNVKQKQLDLSFLSSGVYFVHISDGKNFVNKKLVRL